VVFSLLGYFFSMITVFAAVVAVLIGLFNVSTSKTVRHYSRPVIERTVTATNTEPRLFMVVPGTKDRLPENDIEGTRGAPVEKADTEKRKSEKFAHPQKRQRESYPVALGYAERSGYRAGLDSQR
jgi:hypothetical protein